MTCNNEGKITIVLAVAGFVTIIISGSLIGSGANYIARAGDVDNLPNFVLTNCIPKASQIIFMKNCYIADDHDESKWVAVWQDKTTSYSILKDPFSARDDQKLAQNDLKDYPLNISSSYPCMCSPQCATYPSITNFNKCQIWNTCFFNVAMIKERQQNAASERDLGSSLLTAGGIIMLATFVLLFWGCHVINGGCKRSGYTEMYGPV